MAEFHRKTRGIVVLHRCMLNPADGTFHSLVLFLLGASLPHLGALSHNRDAKSYQHEPCRECTQTHGRTRGIKSCHKRSGRQRLARSSWLAKLPGIRITLILDDNRRRLGFDTFRPRAFDFPPEGRPGHSSGHVEHLGNFLPSKSSVMRAKHGFDSLEKACDQVSPNSGW